MMRSDPHPSSTAENSRFSMMEVTAIHQRLANAVARVGSMVEGKKLQAEPEERNVQRERLQERREMNKLEAQREAPCLDALDEGSLITYL